jgi:hypothetical protein
LTITRKTLEQANAEKGHFDPEKFDSRANTDIERMIAEDPDLAPPTESLTPLLNARGLPTPEPLFRATERVTAD